jgi:hypothetical protein
MIKKAYALFIGFFVVLVILLSISKDRKVQYEPPDKTTRKSGFENIKNFSGAVFEDATKAIGSWVGESNKVSGGGGNKCEWLKPGEVFDGEAYLRQTNNKKLIDSVNKYYGDIISAICYGEDFQRIDLVYAIIIRESSNNPKSHFDSRNSPDTGLGLMGITKNAATEVKVDSDSLFVPYQNIIAGVRYLKKMMEKTHNEAPDAIVSYTCGFSGYQENLSKGRRPVDNIYYQQVKILADLVPTRFTKAKSN